MEKVKLKDLKTGDLAKSIKDATLPNLLIIGINQMTGVKHGIFGDAKIEIDDYHYAWNDDVELISSNNDVLRYQKIHGLLGR